MGERSRTFKLIVSGPNACFTRPEMKVERVSYEVMTPSSARGILEAVLWRPAILWVIEQIDVLNPIAWESVRRNEVGKRMGRSPLYVEEERQQRAGIFLRDVAYCIHAHFEMTDKRQEDDNVGKFAEMFERYCEKGKCYHRPYFGMREFAVERFSLCEDNPVPISESKELGWMLYDLDYARPKPEPMFFYARMKSGSVQIPAPKSEEVKR